MKKPLTLDLVLFLWLAMPITELLVMFYAVSALRRYTAALSDA